MRRRASGTRHTHDSDSDSDIDIDNDIDVDIDVDLGRMRAVVASLRDVVLVRDHAGTLVYCSPSVLDALGYRPDELEGTQERDLVHPGDVGPFDALASVGHPGAESPTLEVRIRDRAGDWHWFEVTENDRLEDPDIAGIVTIAHDVSAHKAEREELLDRSLRDPLTSVPNRLALVERLRVAVSRAQRGGDLVAVLFCDLDDFKLVNDVYGHDFADGVLIEFARRLQGVQRGSDTVARIGGDEFVIVCDGLHDVDEAARIAARVHRAVEDPISINGRQCVITTSIGIATVAGGSGEPFDPMTLLRNADAAMYRAKQQGRAHWHHFDDVLAHDEIRRTELEADLAPALERDELTLHYEPIHDLRDRTIVGIEGIVQWAHPTHGFLPAADLLAAAEQSGLIVPIGVWARNTGCRQARLWGDAGWPGWIALKLSARELIEPDLARSVMKMLDVAGLVPQQLWLEVEEGVFMHAGPSATTELTSLREFGVHVGVSGFGTTDPPLAKLQQLPADFVKIDRALISALTQFEKRRPDGCAIVAALVQIGTALGLAVIAEGVESELETELLVECGCQYGQGDLPSRAATFATRFVSAR